MTATISAPDSCKVYTKQVLADAIVLRLGDVEAMRWLEPSVGPGAFLRAISSIGVLPERVAAFEIEQNVCDCLDLAQVTEGQDFIRWSLETDQRFDRIVGNPPYVALSSLQNELKMAALRVPRLSKKAMRHKVNYWYVFVNAMLGVLREGGMLGLVLPASWDYADYCSDFRDYLPSQFREFEIHRCEQPLFDGVGEGAVVVIAKGYRESPISDERYEYSNFDKLVNGLAQDVKNGKPAIVRPFGRLLNGENFCTLQDVVDISIGGVTGDVKYFLFNDDKRKKSGLPDECFRPILSRARHIRAAETNEQHWDALRQEGERVWLFYPPEHQINHPAVSHYLNLPYLEGGCQREALWVKGRTPWYLMSVPTQIDGFISGMSRSLPFISMNAMPNLTATNTLYTVKFKQSLPKEARYGWALAMLSSDAHVSVLNLIRRYATGLKKLEPKDLLKIELPRPEISDSLADDYHKAIQLHLKGETPAARRLADARMQPYIK